MFTLREIQAWTFPAFIAILVENIILYMLAALVFPDFIGAEIVDLREHCCAHTGWFFRLLVAVLLSSLAKELVVSGHLPERENLAFHGYFIATSLAAALTRREWYHRFLALAGLVMFGIYTMLLFRRVR